MSGCKAAECYAAALRARGDLGRHVAVQAGIKILRSGIPDTIGQGSEYERNARDQPLFRYCCSDVLQRSRAPHFHVRYAGQKALIAIETPALLRGLLSPRALRYGDGVGRVAPHPVVGRLEPGKGSCATQPDRPAGVIMLKDIVAAEPLGDYRLRLRFEDGAEGTTDLAAHLIFRGVFEPLRDPAYFATVRVDPDLGTVVWPNGADLDPDVLYARITGTPISELWRLAECGDGPAEPKPRAG